ncbi:uncharacterized protein V1510DRAFT_420162 [Dipodascopsis tothii]|uniref:uncharacterized protein n=1 Tax=Dipodascopsis tothii TaxID=44089 RepID=UPI0034CDF8BA
MSIELDQLDDRPNEHRIPQLRVVIPPLDSGALCSYKRYDSSRFISKILHQFKSEWLLAQLASGDRVILPYGKHESYENGRLAFQNYIHNIANRARGYARKSDRTTLSSYVAQYDDRTSDDSEVTSVEFKDVDSGVDQPQKFSNKRNLDESPAEGGNLTKIVSLDRKRLRSSELHGHDTAGVLYSNARVEKNFKFCEICKQGTKTPGKRLLLNCISCTFSCHDVCLHVSTSELADIKRSRRFVCKFCRSQDGEHTNRCYLCVGEISVPRATSISSHAPQMLSSFRCTRCKRAAHFQEYSQDKDAHALDQSLAGDKRSLESCCRDCRKFVKRPEKIITWRPVDRDFTQKLAQTPAHEREYLIKFSEDSYLASVWARGDWVISICNSQLLRSFHKSDPCPLSSAKVAIPIGYLTVELVLDAVYSHDRGFADMGYSSINVALANADDVCRVLVKWKALSYTDLTWISVAEALKEEPTKSSFRVAYRQYLIGNYLGQKGQAQLKALEVDRLGPVDSFTDQHLSPLQIEGLQWLYNNWRQRRHCFVADDVALGRDQLISAFVSEMCLTYEEFPVIMISLPQNLQQWKSRLEAFSRDLKVGVLSGTQLHREVQKNYVLRKNSFSNLAVHIVLASSDIIRDEKDFLSSFRWKLMILNHWLPLDHETILNLEVCFKVAILDSTVKYTHEEIQSSLGFLEFSTSRAESQLSSDAGLLLETRTLRRTRSNLDGIVPRLVEIIVPIDLSELQKYIYKSILVENRDLIRILCGKREAYPDVLRYEITKLFRKLRTCLAHPYIYDDKLEEQAQNSVESFNTLVLASNKLHFLATLLPKIVITGGRVLIFTKYHDVLDILEDFLYSMKIKFLRIDDKMVPTEKKRRIEQFNSRQVAVSVVIVSTKCTPSGISSASVDVAIAYEQDLSPINFQLFFQSHHASKKPILVYYMTSKHTVEERLAEKLCAASAGASACEFIDDSTFSNLELMSILQAGLPELFELDNQSLVGAKQNAIMLDKLLESSSSLRNLVEDDNQYSGSVPRVWNNLEGNIQKPPTRRVTHKKPSVDDDLWLLISKASSPVTVRDDLGSCVDFKSAEGRRYENVRSTAITSIQGKDDFQKLESIATGPLYFCDGQHIRHKPGHCPTRIAPIEVCRLCGFPHFSAFGVCPQLRDPQGIKQLVSLLSASTEQNELKNLAWHALSHAQKLVTGER